MADPLCIGAFTPAGEAYPPYLNISLQGHTVIVTVRGRARLSPGGDIDMPGMTGTIEMSADEFQTLMAKAVLRLPITRAPLAETASGQHVETRLGKGWKHE